MNVLLIGGCSTFTNNLINKLNKEGHRIYLLTGSKTSNPPYQKVFEKYRFPYNASCISEIFESINPDVTIFMGAYDSNFEWKERDDAVKYSAAMMNILMGFSANSSGRFIYLSSQDVFYTDYPKDIPEAATPNAVDFKGMILTQAEEMCMNYRRTLSKDIVVLRLDHVFGVPEGMEDVKDPCTEMCLEALNRNVITIQDNHAFSMIYESDAIEQIYRVIQKDICNESLYQISSRNEITERLLAELVRKYIWFNIEIVSLGQNGRREILANDLYEKEFGKTFYCEQEAVIQRIAESMKKNQRVFLYGEQKKKSLHQRFVESLSSTFRLLLPYLENLAAFAGFFMINNRVVDHPYFSALDPYLIYVLIFAMVYGQQQAIISATLAVFGYVFRQTYDRTSFELMLDSSTYIWIAELFILGVSVGYLRDLNKKLRRDQQTEEDFLKDQLTDIRDINDTNVRVKDALETQLVNQNDSVGKIFRITSGLDQYSQEEVLFYAADIIGQLMKSRDVAIYSVSNATYARLFSATSEKARSLGNSIRYTEMGEVYDAFCDRKVYINRQLRQEYPLMANAVYDENDQIQILIMIWGLPFESMTLGQANQLVVISSLIGSAVLRANRYLKVLEEERYIGDTELMEPAAFISLVQAYIDAERRGWTECTVIRVDTIPNGDYRSAVELISNMIRQHDYIGMNEHSELCVLLSNSKEEEAEFVKKRIEEKGFSCTILEDDACDTRKMENATATAN